MQGLLVLGIDGNMRDHVDRGCDHDSAALDNRQDVLRALSGHRSVPEKGSATFSEN